MASTNVYSIPLYTKGYLSAVGYREGCGYNAKIFWGAELLASHSSLMDAALSAYIGTRLYSPKFHSWMNQELRVEILEELEKMSLLIFPTEIHATNDGLMKTLKTGMKWFLDNKLEIKLGDDAINPVETIQIIKNEFMKSERLSVHIKMLTDFKTNPKEDMFCVSLGEDTPKKKLQMRIMEDNLSVSLFGNQWINKAVDSFNSFRRISAQPGEGYPVHGTMDKTILSKKISPVDIESYRSTGVNKLNAMFDGAVTNKQPPTIELKTNTGDFSLNLNGNTISMVGGDMLVSAPKINITSSGQAGYAPINSLNIPGRLALGYNIVPDPVDEDDDQELSDFGKMIRKVGLSSTIELDKNIPFYFVQAYAEMPYIDMNTKMPMPMMEFIKSVLKWDYLKFDYRTWIESPEFNSIERCKQNPQAWEIACLAIQLRTNAEVMVRCENGGSRKVKSFYLETNDQNKVSHSSVNSTFLP